MLDSGTIDRILQYSREEAIRTGWYYITPDHLILGIIRHRRNLACHYLEKNGIDLDELKSGITSKISLGVEIKADEWNTIEVTPELRKVLESSSETMALNIHYDDSLVFLMSVIGLRDTVTGKILSDSSITRDKIKDFLESGQGADSTGQTDAPLPYDETEEDTPEDILSSCCTNLVEAAAKDLLDPVIGREKEIDRVIEVLCCRRKNNPILIGEPGCGKTAIIEGLANRIAKGKIPFTLLGKSIMSMDIPSIAAGERYRQNLETKVQAILNALRMNPDIIVFIDDLHTLLKSGQNSAVTDVAEMLKQAIGKGDFQCIGTTTPNEYRVYIEKDIPMEKRFQKIMVDPPSHTQTAEILKVLSHIYGDYHHVQYTEEALSACISLSTKYISDRSMPAKAIDLMDEAGARVIVKRCAIPEEFFDLIESLHTTKNKKRKAVGEKNPKTATYLKRKEASIDRKICKMIKDIRFPEIRPEITVSDIQDATSAITGIPVSKISQTENRKLLEMDCCLKGKVVGQDQAIENIVKAIIRNKVGIKDPGKPIGTFLFLGPTGVGKTHLAKLLAEYLFDTPDAIIRLDMSEYMEKFMISRLIGAPPGYIGYNDGGQLSNRVRQKPYSVILLDEIEKAHPDIFNLLLQIMDEGRLTDSSGMQVDFRNTILIMTSNIGSRDLSEYGNGVGYSSGMPKNNGGYNKRIIDKAIGKVFPPEFINRLDDIVYFNSLSKENISRIVDIEMSGLYRRASDAGYPITLTDKAKDFICSKGYDPKFGARPLKRAITRYIEDIVAEIILSNNDEGRKKEIRLDLNEGGDALAAV